MSNKDSSDTFRLVEESLRMFAAKIADQIKEINRRIASIQEEVLHLNRRTNALEENTPTMPPRSLKPSQTLTSTQIRSDLRTALEAPVEPEPEVSPEVSTGGLAAELRAAEERPATVPRLQASSPRPATVPRYKATSPRPTTTERFTPTPQEQVPDLNDKVENATETRGTSRQKDKKDLLDALKIIDSI